MNITYKSLVLTVGGTLPLDMVKCVKLGPHLTGTSSIPAPCTGIPLSLVQAPCMSYLATKTGNHFKLIHMRASPMMLTHGNFSSLYILASSWYTSDWTFFLLTDTVAFHTALTDYSSIPIGSAVEFNEVLLNEGDGYVLTFYN